MMRASTRPSSGLLSALVALAKQFHDNLGHFGGKHTDDHDAPLGFTHLLSYSDLCANEDPGFFVILTFGVCLRLSGLYSCCFGQHTHGGFHPTSHPGCAPDPRSYLVVIVSYPTGAAFNAIGKYILMNFSDKLSFELPKEAMDPKSV